MEPRRILITNESLTTCKEIMSTALTVAELKAEMTQAGIEYADKTLVEGRSRTKFEDDSQQLPLTVMYKGQHTKELSIMLMTPAKKVASGASERSEIYAAIKQQGLEEAIKDAFGKNFTQVTTAELKQFYADTMSNRAASRAGVREVEEAEVAMTSGETIPAVAESERECCCTPEGADGRCRQAILELVDILEEYGSIDGHDKETIYAILGGEKERMEEKDPKSDDSVLKQIKDDFSWMKR